MYCNTNQFPSLLFCGPHSKPHGTRGLDNHYHFRFYPKLGMGVCAIRRIPCACVACTSMLDKPWISGIKLDQQDWYKPVTKFTDWPVLMYKQHMHMVYGKLYIYPYQVLDQNANENACPTPLRHVVWNMDHRRVMMGIDLCYNTFLYLWVP